MKDRRGQADLLWVALGADKDEWCVRSKGSRRSKNGRVWWGGTSKEADEALRDILVENGDIELKYIDFGTKDSFFLLYK